MPATKKSQCASPGCKKSSHLQGKFCKFHFDLFMRLRDEIEMDPRSLYNQRSDNPERQMINSKTGKVASKKRPRVPVCCKTGCFDIRVPPSPFCDAHEDEPINE